MTITLCFPDIPVPVELAKLPDQIEPEVVGVTGSILWVFPEGAQVIGRYIFNTPEPQDVPAIQEETDYCFRTYEGCFVRHLDETPTTTKEWFHGDSDRFKLYRWTCADKTRVLLTSEDGKKHCVRLN